MTKFNWTNAGKGIIAGFTATIVLSVLMLMKQAIGFMPQLNPIQMITQMMGAQSSAVGWLVHFFIGTIMWGLIFVWLDPLLPGRHWLRGVIFATGAWLIMMIMMPMAEAGLFGLGLGLMAPIATTQ